MTASAACSEPAACTGYTISGELRMPPGGIIARWRDKEVVIREVPAEVVVRQ